MARKLAGYALLALLAFYVLTNPTGAAHGVHSGLHGLAHLAGGVGEFVNA